MTATAEAMTLGSDAHAGRMGVEPVAIVAPDGQEITVWRWPHQRGRPTLHWAHATGFHGRTYHPLLDTLAEDFNVLAWDMRGHGASAAAGALSSFRGWRTYYDDLCALVESQEEPVWLAGHSIGATASIMAAARLPARVQGLVLAEPVILDRVQGLQLRTAKLLRQSHRFGLAAGAARRRAHFASRAEAVEKYRGRGGFRSWPAPWLDAYVEHGFVDDDMGVRLACAPAWESATFTHTEHNAWPDIRRLRCPVIALSASHASTFAPAARQRLRTVLPAAEVTTVTNTTHFLPMEHPQAVADAIRRLLAQQAGTRAQTDGQTQ
ncbi:MAG TPA: alpha/beta hydrolase [Solimonas sp.]|nr:alpha/beta hydrolase [Solimonas fluminis]MDM4771607.1 alpha/beta hydrolase [Solimonas sp. SE-A11]HEX4895759.1 alpha/beta hydrolase [Solimonas sp.]